MRVTITVSPGRRNPTASQGSLRPLRLAPEGLLCPNDGGAGAAFSAAR
jgi:hypothetical protein